MTRRASLSIVVEDATDAHLIRALVGTDLARNLRFFATAGSVSLATVGRNILVHEGGPVLLVMDANTRNQQLVDELQSLAYIATSGVAPPNLDRLGDWVKVFAFVPEIEVVFFEQPGALGAILGTNVPEEKVQEGLLAPKATLLRLLEQSKINYPTLATGMRPQLASMLASGKQAKALKVTIVTMTTSLVHV
jgi:hypothetical protein